MSLAIDPLKVVTVKDPLIKINEERKFPVLKGGQRVTWKPVISTSHSNSSAQFTAPSPSPGIFVDRRIEISYPVKLEFTGTPPVDTPNQNLIQSGYDAFRAYPISSITNTLTVTINNNSSSINMSDVIQPLLRYNTDRDLQQHTYSTTPTMMDTYQRYPSGDQTMMNPLAQYAENTYQTPRGGFPMEITNLSPTTATVEATLTEPIFLSPLLFGGQNKSAFMGVQTLDFNFTFIANLARLWSHSSGSGSTISNITVTLGTPTLLFKYITPKELQSIPRSIVYSFYDVQRYPTDAAMPFAPNEKRALISANIQLQSIPRRMYIFARKRNADITATVTSAIETTDTYFQLNDISINWNNNSGLLSSARQQDLYYMSAKNGFEGSWAQWSGGPVERALGSDPVQKLGTVGSILCVEFGTDIGLDNLECPGMLGTYQLQFSANFTNINQTESITPTLYCVVISEGTFTIMENRSIAQIGVVSKQDVLDSKFAPEVDYELLDDQYGGNFWSGLKDVGKSVFKGIKEAAPYAEKAAELGLKYGPMVAPLLAAGSVVGGRPYAQDEKDREDEARAMEAYWRAKKGGKKKYAQTRKDKQDEAKAMEAYWRAKKGGKVMGRRELSKRLAY